MSAELIDLLNDSAATEEATATLPSRWLEEHAPQLVEPLQRQGFLLRDASPEYVEYNGDTHRIHFMERLGTAPVPYCFEDEEDYSGTHFLTDEEQRGRRFQFTPLAELLHRGLSCRGAIREAVPGFLWLVGTATQQAREVWLCRGNGPAVLAHLAELPKSALLFRFGIYGTYNHADVFLDALLPDYLTDSGGMLGFDREALSDVIAAMLKANGSTTAKRPAFGVQNNIQMAIEEWVWSWFDARLKAAKGLAYDDEPDPDVNTEWAAYDILTQKHICDRLGISPKTFTRTKEAWKKDVCGYGRLFLLIAEEFICRRARKDSETPENAVSRLNDFYHLHRDIIESARQHRAHNI